MTEKLTRTAIKKHGIESVIKDEKRIKISEDLIAEAADDLGRLTGSSREANNLIEQSTSIIGDSAETQRKMKRPDLYPEYSTESNRDQPIRRRMSTLVTAPYLKRKGPAAD